MKKKKRTLTPEQLEAARARMAKARAARKPKLDGGQFTVSAEETWVPFVAALGEQLSQEQRDQELDASFETPVDIPAVIEEPAEVEITIDKLPPNPRLVMGRVAQDSPQLSVWVGNAQNFALQMKIKVHPHPTEAGLWEYSGPRPKQKGRWL